MQIGTINVSIGAGQDASQPGKRRSLDQLTQREREILACLSEGNTTKEMARLFRISPRTVQKHLQRIYAKLGVGGRTAAALIAVRSFSQNK